MRAVIGIDQAYSGCGLAIALDGKIRATKKINARKTHSEFRRVLMNVLSSMITKCYSYTNDVTIIVERVRVRNNSVNPQNFFNAGELYATIIDLAYFHEVKVYSVDTISWKAKVVGTHKQQQNTLKYPPEKYPTVQFLLKQGYDSFFRIFVSNKKRNGVFGQMKVNGAWKKFSYDSDIADSMCIALYAFINKKEQKLKLEE